MYKLFALFCLLGCAARPVASRQVETNPAPIAFPGAEGFGKYTTGGRGGKVLIVSNLNDKGPGSFREAAEAKGKRIIVFSVAGTIHLESNLNISGDVTIAGQSAPGEGICIADYNVKINGSNSIIRYLRFRMGDRYQGLKGMVDGSGGDDAVNIGRVKNVIIDHCSMSWSTDEVFSAYGGDSTTIQWNLIAEPLNYSYHFETGDKDWEHHGYGGIWGGVRLSAHHNLIMHCESRMPRFNGARLGTNADFVDYRNNVIYNWGHNNVYGGEGGRYNVVANYYKPGPSTRPKVAGRIVNPSYTKEQGFGKFYVQENVVEGSPNLTGNNKPGVHVDKIEYKPSLDTILVSTAFAAVDIPPQDATTAYQLVLKHVGASYARDTMDARLMNEVSQTRGRIIDVQGGFPHGTPYEISKVAWPVLKTGSALKDSDNDGMPDEWEKKNGLDPMNPADASETKPGTFYTQIEVYLNSLIHLP